LEFEEFITLAAKFIVEEDAEAMQKELREAFRLYDKEGKYPDGFCLFINLLKKIYVFLYQRPCALMVRSTLFAFARGII